MVFSMFSKKTQPGYGVKRQVLLVLTACTCTTPPPPKKESAGRARSKELTWLHTMMMIAMKTLLKMNCVLSNFTNLELHNLSIVGNFSWS